MARQGLLKILKVADPVLDRVQANTKDAVEVLAADHDVLSAPVLSMTVSGAISPGRSVVVFRGNAGATLTLPLANAQGQNTSALVVLANASMSSVTVRPAGSDTLVDGAGVVLAPGQAIFLVSDGSSKWLTAGDADQEMDLRLISLRV